MNKYTVNIVPEKMKSARVSRGYNQKELADKIGISRQSIRNYEEGINNITKGNLDKFVEVLDYPIEYFITGFKYNMDNARKTSIFFRSSSVTETVRDIYQEKFDHLFLIHRVLSKYIDFPEFNIQELKDIIGDRGYGYSGNEIEQKALKLREIWGLGKGPIEDLTYSMMEKGIVISKVKTNRTATTDAFLQRIGDNPLIFLNAFNGTAVRDRFSLAHELGHIILHYNTQVENLKEKDIYNQVEYEANRFASAFLLPSESFINDVVSIDINSLIPLKSKWKVSIKGIVMRLKELDIINGRQATNNFISISKNKWNINEPLDDVIEREHYNIYKQSFEMLFEDKIVSPEIILSDICLSKNRVESICNLGEGFFDKFNNTNRNIPNLRIIK